MTIRQQVRQENKGVIAVLALMTISAFGVAMVSTMSTLAASQVRIESAQTATEKTYASAESGIEEALYRLLINPLLPEFDVSLDNTTSRVTVEVDPNDPYQRIITSSATDVTGKQRTLRVIVTTAAFGGGFDSAVQTGAGGLFMDNNSLVVGNVFSNGSILPGTGSNCSNHRIIGSASVAGPSGRIENMQTEVDAQGNGGHAYGHTIEESCIGGDAYYQTIVNTSVAGSQFPGSPDPSPVPLPITDTEINDWKADIDASGNPVIVASPPGVCPNQPPFNDGSYYCIMADIALSNQKIDANVFIKGDISLTMGDSAEPEEGGNIWATGNVWFENAGAGHVRIDPALGPSSAVLIADGTIDISNNYIMEGTGNPSSFILIISTSTNIDVEPPAIYASNGSQSIVFAAPNGEIRVKNGGTVNASSAQKIRLNQNSSVIYNENLRSFVILSGNNQSIQPVTDSWEEL